MWSLVLPPDPDARQPSSRCKHAMCQYRGSIFMYGGRDGNRSLKDLWQYNLVSGKWTEIRAKGDKPGCLEEHSLVSYKGKLYAFGGEFSFTSVGEIPLWVLNLDTNIWEKPPIKHKTANPSGRRGHTAVVCNDAMHIYGGYIDLKGSNSELWTYRFGENSWHLKYNHQMTPDGPGARHCHSAVIYDQAMWVFGGMNDLNPRGDFWKWDFHFERWSRIRSKPSPPDLQGHSSCKVSDGILLFGGETNGVLSNELWKFQFRTQTWFKIHVQGSQALGRTRHVSLLVTPLSLNSDDTPDSSPAPTKQTHLTASSADSTERSHSAPYLKKASQLTEVENRPYSSPPVLPTDSPTQKRFRNKIEPNQAMVENGGDSDSWNRVRGWEFNRDEFMAKTDKKDTCKNPMIEMTELVPLIRPKMTHSSTFDSCDSIRGIDNAAYRKSSDGSLMSGSWDDTSLNSMPNKHGEKSHSLDALKEISQEMFFSEMVLTPGDKSDKRRSLPLENVGRNSGEICDKFDTNIHQNTGQNQGHLVALDRTVDILAKLNTNQSDSDTKGKGHLTNVYHGNLIDLNTVVKNPDPHKTFVDLLVSSQDYSSHLSVNNRYFGSQLEDNQSSTGTSSSNTPTHDASGGYSSCTETSVRSSVDSHGMSPKNVKVVSPNAGHKGALPGVVKSGSLDSMKQLKIFRVHATHIGSSDDSSCHDDVFLEDVDSGNSDSEDDCSESEKVRLITKSEIKTVQPVSDQNGHGEDQDVKSEKAPLIVQGQSSRTGQRGSVIARGIVGDDASRKREQMRRQRTAPPLGYKYQDDLYNVSTMFTFGGREQEAQYLSIKPISVWKYTFKEDNRLIGHNHRAERYRNHQPLL